MPEIRKWKKQKVKLAEVKPMPDNPRAITEANVEALRKSMERFGYVEPIVWNKRTGHIVGGHQRYSVLSKAGVEEATMVVVDISEDEEMAANITLNNPEIEGEWDDTATELMEQVQSAAPELAEALRIGELKEFVEGMKPRQSEENYGDRNEEVDIDAMSAEFDTKCPCCGFGWKVDANDVSVEGDDAGAPVSVQVEEDRPDQG